MLCGLAALLVVQPRSIAAAMVDLPFEHAFGGGAFVRAGRLVGDLDGQVNLEQARRNLFRCSSFGNQMAVSISRGLALITQLRWVHHLHGR